MAGQDKLIFLENGKYQVKLTNQGVNFLLYKDGAPWEDNQAAFPAVILLLAHRVCELITAASNKPIPRVGPFKSEMMMRDVFAMHALTGLVLEPGRYSTPHDAAVDAYRLADAMLEARNANR